MFFHAVRCRNHKIPCRSRRSEPVGFLQSALVHRNPSGLPLPGGSFAAVHLGPLWSPCAGCPAPICAVCCRPPWSLIVSPGSCFPVRLSRLSTSVPCSPRAPAARLRSVRSGTIMLDLARVGAPKPCFSRRPSAGITIYFVDRANRSRLVSCSPP